MQIIFNNATINNDYKTIRSTKKALNRAPFLFLIIGLKLARQETADLVLYDHKYDVKDPNDVPTKDQTDKTCYNFAFHKSGYETAYP